MQYGFAYSKYISSLVDRFSQQLRAVRALTVPLCRNTDLLITAIMGAYTNTCTRFLGGRVEGKSATHRGHVKLFSFEKTPDAR